MSKVIDLDLDLPDEEEVVRFIKMFVLNRGDRGVANYRNIFGASKARELGLTLEELDRMADELSLKEFEDMLRERVKQVVVPLPEFVKQMDEAEVEWGIITVGGNEEIITSENNDRTAEIVSQFPDRFIGQVVASPLEGMKGVRELERGVKELGLKSFLASPYHYGIRLNDKKFYPLYAKAVELDVPVFMYCTMNYRTDRPMDVGRPLYLDEVAMDFPEMTIFAGWGGGGGWPWVPEMIGVARRHRNVNINTSAHRPKYLATPGSGWEMLMQFGNTLLQDQIVFASGWSNYLQPAKGVLKKVVEEMKALPLKEEVKEKWLYKNAARIFHRD